MTKQFKLVIFVIAALALLLTSCSKPTYELEEAGEEITYEEFMEAYESFEGYVDEDFSILALDIDITLTYMISIGFVDENDKIQPSSDIYYEYQIDSDKGNVLLIGKTHTASSNTEETYNYQIQKNKDDNSEEYPYIYINLDDKTYEYKTKDEIEALLNYQKRENIILMNHYLRKHTRLPLKRMCYWRKQTTLFNCRQA